MSTCSASHLSKQKRDPRRTQRDFSWVNQIKNTTKPRTRFMVYLSSASEKHLSNVFPFSYRTLEPDCSRFKCKCIRSATSARVSCSAAIACGDLRCGGISSRPIAVANAKVAENIMKPQMAANVKRPWAALGNCVKRFWIRRWVRRFSTKVPSGCGGAPGTRKWTPLAPWVDGRGQLATNQKIVRCFWIGEPPVKPLNA